MGGLYGQGGTSSSFDALEGKVAASVDGGEDIEEGEAVQVSRQAQVQLSVPVIGVGAELEASPLVGLVHGDGQKAAVLFDDPSVLQSQSHLLHGGCQDLSYGDAQVDQLSKAQDVEDPLQRGSVGTLAAGGVEA